MFFSGLNTRQPSLDKECDNVERPQTHMRNSWHLKWTQEFDGLVVFSVWRPETKMNVQNRFATLISTVSSGAENLFVRPRQKVARRTVPSPEGRDQNIDMVSCFHPLLFWVESTTERSFLVVSWQTRFLLPFRSSRLWNRIFLGVAWFVSWDQRSQLWIKTDCEKLSFPTPATIQSTVIQVSNERHFTSKPGAAVWLIFSAFQTRGVQRFALGTSDCLCFVLAPCCGICPSNYIDFALNRCFPSSCHTQLRRFHSRKSQLIKHQDHSPDSMGRVSVFHFSILNLPLL